MRGLIRASLRNPWAVTVFALTIVLLGTMSLFLIPIDILPAFKTPAVQVLTFYGGMPPQDVESDITHRMERWTGMAPGIARQEARSILGASLIRNYFHDDVDRAEALSSEISMAQAEIPSLPPGTLPPIVMAFDPTAMTPVALVALNSKTASESDLYDVGRYEVRSRIMQIQGAISPVVFGGKIRAVQIYLDRAKMQARDVAPLDVMNAVASSNVFLPTGEAIVGDMDYFLNSNSLFEKVEDMGSIPLRTEHGNRAFVRDVAEPTDSSLIQTTIVRVGEAEEESRKQVYIPVMRSMGASTLRVVDTLKSRIGDIQSQLTNPGIQLEVIMDQSVYVSQSIRSLATEGALGALLCSLVILLFLGRWRMTMIAVMTIPLAILAAIGLLYAVGGTINVMTLSGLAMAIGPLIDTAIVCLENTDRHLERGSPLQVAALEGPSEVSLPVLVASLSTLLVLLPLALMPGTGSFLFRPMTMAVGFAMGVAYLLSQTFVPARSAGWLKDPSQEPDDDRSDADPGRGNLVTRAFDKWQHLIESGITWYSRRLDWVLENAVLVLVAAFAALLLVTLLVFPIRREFFPEVDSGAFEMYVRAPSGTKLEKTNEIIARVEDYVRRQIPASDLKLIVSEIGVTPDWSSAYTPNAGKMDAVVRIQLTEDHAIGAYEYADKLRKAFAGEGQFHDLEFAFNAGGLIRGALNEGQPTPINIRVVGKEMETSHEIADRIRREVAEIDGVVDARIIQRLNYPEYLIEVDRGKAADLGLTQEEVMKNVIAAFNSSIQYNKNIFWVDSVSGNQYFVGVQYPLEEIESLETLLDVPITGVNQSKHDRRVANTRTASLIEADHGSDSSIAPTVPLSNLVTLRRSSIPTEITDVNLRQSIDLNIGVHGRDLGHVASDVQAVVARHGRIHQGDSGVTDVGTVYDAFDPKSDNREVIPGTEIVLTGEYARMNQTFKSLGIGLILAIVLIYFLMVTLAKSYLVPLTIILAVPLVVLGVLPMLYLTGTSINVQSLLGLIFVVGIQVSNSVLLTDVAQTQRKENGLSPIEAIRKAGALRVRPVIMTALAAFFAMIPTALALESGSEANAPLGRAILGGLIAGTPATLLVVPALYALMIRGDYEEPEDPDSAPDRGSGSGGDGDQDRPDREP